MSVLIAGIDGGQSSTGAVVLDAESGELLGRSTSGPSDHVGEPPESERAALAVEHALAAALGAVGGTDSGALAAVGIGLSGYEGAWHGRPPQLPAPVVHVVHDAVAALAGAIAERPAAVVIAGTGSAAYGESAGGLPVRAGGFGYLFGDEGSSFWLARAALAEAMRATDRNVPSALGTAALAYFECADLRRLARAVALGAIERPRIASFARVVHDAARLGDPSADALLAQAADALADLAAVVVRRLSPDRAVPVAFVGGAMDDPAFRALAGERASAQIPQARVVLPRWDAAIGAALLACDAAGLRRPEPRA